MSKALSGSVGGHISSKRTILEQGHKELEKNLKVSGSEENKELRADSTDLGIRRTHS